MATRWAGATLGFAMLVAGAFAISEPARAETASALDGIWLGEAALECDSMGDPRPPIRVRTEFSLEGKQLSGTWTAPNGETYEVTGGIGAHGRVVDGSASSTTQYVSFAGNFGETGAKGSARGTFPGNLKCTGTWTAERQGGAAVAARQEPVAKEEPAVQSAPAPVKEPAAAAQPAKVRSSASGTGVDGLWRGSATLECNNMGDSRPGMTAEIEMRIAEGRLSGAWTTSTGHRYELDGEISARGAIEEAAARLEPAMLDITGDLKGEGGKGKVRGVVLGNLNCQGAWTVALVERAAAPALAVDAAAPRETVKSKAASKQEAAAAPEPVPTKKKASKSTPKPPEPPKEVVQGEARAEPDVAAEEGAANAHGPSFSPGRYVALVIGNNDYDDLPDLKTAVNDATAMAAILADRYGFDTHVLKNASRKDVLSAMAKLRAALDYDSSLLIYYAGHGHVDEVTERGYWLPVDAARDDPSNWISTADITDMLKASPARAVLVIADSCYSGALTRAAPVSLPSAEKRDAFIARMASKRARTVFASGGIEPVEDGGGGKHSVFAKALIETLSENSEVIDAQTLFSPVRHRVVLNAEQTPEYSDVRLAGHEGGDFVFVPRR